MTEPLLVKRMEYGISEDGQAIEIAFIDGADDGVAIAVPKVAMPGFVGEMVKFIASLRVDEVFAPTADQSSKAGPTLPATETAMLVVQSARLVRSTNGGAIFLASTDAGVNVQLGLLPETVDALRQVLNADLPAE